LKIFVFNFAFVPVPIVPAGGSVRGTVRHSKWSIYFDFRPKCASSWEGLCLQCLDRTVDFLVLKLKTDANHLLPPPTRRSLCDRSVVLSFFRHSIIL